ncbi:MAG: hypothetical protein GX574_12220 [Lentisphaerae bacterium]|nr:hypothetical protein [Lentisphaerota bacterium]OQC15172.1 MAG: hypothetical protein BWX73_01464 [Lentisphaerae bacterium ADurb.Bin082]
MNDQKYDEPRKAVKSLLDTLQVKRVVYVDDRIQDTVPLEDVIAAAIGLDEASLRVTFPGLGDSIPDDQDMRTAKIRDVWKDMSPEERASSGQAVVIAAREQGDDETGDMTDASNLRLLIPGDRQLVNLSPSHWETQKEQLLKESSREELTLFLFDQDFSGADGDVDGGIKIIASLLDRDDTEDLICGLLTHKVTPDDQPKQWQDLSEKHGIEKDRFIVIPKQHLSQDPMLFALALKFVALSPDFTKLKNEVKEIISEAASAAAKRVEKVNIYDLDHIVFRGSFEEGLWEPDMLFRLHALFLRTESLKLAHEGGVLEELAAKLRSVSGIPTDRDPVPPPVSAWSLQREELYEFGDIINKNHLPLELGDIFEKVSDDSSKNENTGVVDCSKKYYILLAQPCDLMVRSKGKREPDLIRVPLAEVVQREKCPHYSEEIPCFDDHPRKNKWFVRMKMVHFVQISILDLCVLNDDGVGRLVIGADGPKGLRPAWQKRCLKLKEHWSNKLSPLGKLSFEKKDSQDVRQVKEKLRESFLKAILSDVLFKGKIESTGNGQVLTYGCKRIARLSRVRAMGLLMSYTSTCGRPAYERDFVASHQGQGNDENGNQG